MNKIFYIPMYYWYNYNLKGFNNLLGYIFTLHLPILSFLFIFLDLTNILYFLISYILSFLIFIIFYEFFYIQNDYLSKNEISPTYRYDFSKIKIPWYKIILVRLLYIISIYIILYYLNINIFSHILYLFMIGIFFLIHNFIKVKLRFITFFILFFLKVGIFFQFLINIPFYYYFGYIFLISLFGTIPYFYKKNLKLSFPIDTIVLYLILLGLLGLYNYIIFDNFLLIFITFFLVIIRKIKLINKL